MAASHTGIRGRKAWQALTKPQRAAYDRAVNALNQMRTSGLSLTRAAKEAGTTPRAIQKYVGSALQRDDGGRISARTSDRLYRRMTAITNDGPVTIEVRGSRTASLLGRHANAVQQFVQTGDARDLRAFRGRSVNRHQLASDPDVIRRLARRGALDFEDLYDLTV